MTSSFSNLSLAEPLARAVAEMGYESMTPIQAQAIPVVLTGRDVMGAAQTGTGRDGSLFAAPAAKRLLKHENSSTHLRATPCAPWCCCPRGNWPIRSAADRPVRQNTKLRSTVVFGGMDMKPRRWS